MRRKVDTGRRGSRHEVQADGQATKDPFYLRVGERVLNDMRRRTMTECGLATMKNVDTGEVSCPHVGNTESNTVADKSSWRIGWRVSSSPRRSK